jgi:hypothetical protein
VRHALTIALVALAAAACGSEQASAPAAPPPTLPATALPQLDARQRVLDRETLAQDAFEPDQLASVLEDAGYLAGREREFSGKSPTFDHVIARTLLFEDLEGAEAYLAWTSRHADEVLGKAEPAKIVTPGAAGATYKLVRCGTCKKELPTYFSVWRRGSTVFWLLAAGSGADSGFQALADEFDGSRMAR